MNKLCVAFDSDLNCSIADCGASSSATSQKSDFIEGTYKPLKGVTISGIASGLEASGIGSIMLNLTDDKGDSFAIQIDKVLHLKQLLNTLISL